MAKAINPILKKNIIEDIKKCVSYRLIAKKYNVSIGLVNKIKKQNSLEVPRNYGGRSQKLSPAMIRIAKRLIVSGATDTAVETNTVLRETHEVSVSDRTMCRYLNKSGLKAKTVIKKPLLNEKHRKARLKFAKTYENYTVDDWMKVTWSDETKINLVGSDGRKWTWVDTRVGVQERNICQTAKFGGGSLMVWGCFRGSELGVLRRIKGIMRAADYITILEDSYLPSLDIFGIERGQSDIFMQDNDPKHTAKITKKWFLENGIKLLEWPPQSPDLNPIEHLWAILKRKIFAEKDPPKSLDELWERALLAWENINPNILENLIKSMPERIKAVKKSRGGHTKF